MRARRHGERRDVTITVIYAIPANYAGASIANTASVTSPTADPDPTDNSSTATTPTPAIADLSVAKTGPASVSAGGAITYTVVVDERGTGRCRRRAVHRSGTGCDHRRSARRAAHRAAARSAAASTSRATSSRASFRRCRSAASVTFTITGTAPNDAQSLTQYRERRAAGRHSPIRIRGNNSSTRDDRRSARRPMSRSSRTGPANVASGAAISYTLRIANAGPSAADGTSYTDALPAGITGIVASCGGATGGARLRAADRHRQYGQRHGTDACRPAARSRSRSTALRRSVRRR